MTVKRLRCITVRCTNYAEEGNGLCGTCTEARYRNIWYRKCPLKHVETVEGYIGDQVD